MVSVERISEYAGIEPESGGDDGQPMRDWPTRGGISFRNVSLTYDNTVVLKSVSFRVEPEQKIGIVGRTGAGKSSIVQALFRLVDTQGTIEIDGVDVTTVSKAALRRSITIIPQNVSLFSGTIRDNLDPFSEHTDDELWKALSEVRLIGGLIDWILS